MKNDPVIMIAACLLALTAGILIGCEVSKQHWKYELVKKGYAEYNQQTAEWQWKEAK